MLRNPTVSSFSFDCLFVGTSTKDLLMLVNDPPASDARITSPRMVATCGGPGSTAAAAFSKLGGRTALITAVGEDDAGQYIIDDLTSRGFFPLNITRIPEAASSFSVIQVEPNGNRCITCFGGCTNHWKLDMLPPELLEKAPMIHLAGLSEAFIEAAIRYCREHSNALISVDGGNYSPKVTEAFLPYTDLYIPDEKTVFKGFGMSAEKACIHFHRLGASTVCITLGKRGSLAYDGQNFFQAPAAHVKVLDTTGAGDNFHGAFLYGLLHKFDLQKTLQFANTFSGLTCEGLGGRESLPSLEQVFWKMDHPEG